MRDLNLRVEIEYDGVTVERIIAYKTTIKVGESKIELSETEVEKLYKALTAYVKADPTLEK